MQVNHGWCVIILKGRLKAPVECLAEGEAGFRVCGGRVLLNSGAVEAVKSCLVSGVFPTEILRAAILGAIKEDECDLWVITLRLLSW